MFDKETNIEARNRGYNDGEAGKSAQSFHSINDPRTEAYLDGHRLGNMAYLGRKNGILDRPKDIEWMLDDAVEDDDA